MQQAELNTPLWNQSSCAGDHWAAGGRRSTRDWVVDVAMTFAAVLIGALVLGESWHEHTDVTAAIDIALGVVGIASLWWRRSHPVAVGVLGAVLATFAASAGGAAAFGMFNAALRGPRRALGLIVGLNLAGAALYPVLYPSGDSYFVDVSVGVLVTGIALGWGLFARARRALVYSLRERADRLEAEQQLRVAQAREAERRRIAREMHDVLAHRVSLLSLHAGALEFRPDATTEEIAESAAVIRANANAALEELSEVIGVLRADGDDDAPEPPQPTLVQVPALVEESRAAGMKVICHINVPGGESLPALLGRTAYRIVQEGLTNARKHAPGAAVEVTISASGSALDVEVLSRQPVRVAAAPEHSEPLPGAGSGLVGLTERVALAGGELEHGPDERGDFRLRATLPWAH